MNTNNLLDKYVKRILRKVIGFESYQVASYHADIVNNKSATLLNFKTMIQIQFKVL